MRQKVVIGAFLIYKHRNLLNFFEGWGCFFWAIIFVVRVLKGCILWCVSVCHDHGDAHHEWTVGGTAVGTALQSWHHGWLRSHGTTFTNYTITQEKMSQFLPLFLRLIADSQMWLFSAGKNKRTLSRDFFFMSLCTWRLNCSLLLQENETTKRFLQIYSASYDSSTTHLFLRDQKLPWSKI